jgi:spore germination cell wall hydrolase CwlJ-like protein
MCLALNLYHEARGESRVGRLAVMNVVKNRAESTEFPGHTICEVVMSGANNRSRKCAFSWTCDGRSDIPKDMKLYDKMEREARLFLMNDRIDDITDGAIYFHSVAVNPNWKFERTARIDNHIFYR